jgi:hypothetical protein
LFRLLCSSSLPFFFFLYFFTMTHHSRISNVFLPCFCFIVPVYV